MTTTKIKLKSTLLMLVTVRGTVTKTAEKTEGMTYKPGKQKALLHTMPVSGAPELPEDRDRDRHRDWDRDFGIY